MSCNPCLFALSKKNSSRNQDAMYALSRIDSSTIARTMNAALVFLLASCAAPPIGPVPPSVELPQLAVGGSWTYQVRDGYNHGLIHLALHGGE
jgi:hypothetical protein